MRLVSVLEAAAAEIRHRVGLAPDDVVEDPEAEVLHASRRRGRCCGRSRSTQIVPLGFSTRRAASSQARREGVIGGEAVELVPVVVDGVDLRLVGTVQVAVELQIVGRVGEDHVDRLLGQPARTRRRNRPSRIVSSQSGCRGNGGKFVGKTHGRHA